MAKKHDIIWYDTLDSTNDEARRHILHLDNLSVISARRQTAGRGQRGSTWSAEAGLNLTFSIVCRYCGSLSEEYGSLPPVMADDQFAISALTALSVVSLLKSHGITAKVKWPNDIYVGNMKICGILIENSLIGASLSHSIIGIGLNVNQTVFDPSLPNPTSMAACNGREIKPATLLEEFMDIFSKSCTDYLSTADGLPRLRTEYLERLWRMEETASYVETASGREFSGRIKGLSEIGHIIIEDTEKGELKEFAFKEIGYII